MTERSEGITKSETFRSSDKQASERSERAKSFFSFGQAFLFFASTLLDPLLDWT